MPTTRHGYSRSAHAIGALHAESNAFRYVEEGRHGRWKPLYNPESNPIRHGIEAFFQRTLPDGHPLTPDERKFIAGLAIEQLKEGA